MASERDRGAVRSLVLGILGLISCPLVFSVAAVYESLQSRKRIRESDGWLDGDEVALAGLVLGIVGLALVPIVGLLIVVSG